MNVLLLILMMTRFLDLLVVDIISPIPVYLQVMLDDILKRFFRELVLTDETLYRDKHRIVRVLSLNIVGKNAQNLLVYLVDSLDLFTDSISDNNEVVHVICVLIDEDSLSIAFVENLDVSIERVDVIGNHQSVVKEITRPEENGYSDNNPKPSWCPEPYSLPIITQTSDSLV